MSVQHKARTRIGGSTSQNNKTMPDNDGGAGVPAKGGRTGVHVPNPPMLGQVKADPMYNAMIRPGLSQKSVKHKIGKRQGY